MKNETLPTQRLKPQNLKQSFTKQSLKQQSFTKQNLKQQSLKKAKQFLSNNQGTLALGSVLMLASLDVSAMTTPTTGSLLYDAYDIAYNKILDGPGGFMAGGAGVAYAIYLWTQHQAGKALSAVIATGTFVKLPTVMTSLGATTHLLI